MATERDFTGVFIPAHIWESKELIPAEKMILGEIDCLSKKTGWCTAGRKHFAEWLNCSLPNVSYYFTKLKEAGYIEIVENPGYSSKYRVVTNAFYVQKNEEEKEPEVVNGTDHHPSAGLTGVVNGIDGGSKPGLPEIQYKYNSKEHSVANATESAIPTTENASKKTGRGAVDPGQELGYTFENFWVGYGFKKGSKKNALAKWLRLKTEEVALIQATIEMYLRETVTEDAGRDHSTFKPMRKHPEFYLSAKVWETYADLASESSAPTEYDGLYNDYLAWVKTHFPDTIPAVLYLSKQQYIAVKTHGYKAGARKIGDESIKFLLKQAHQQAAINKDKDVYSYYCALIDERLKLHSI